MSLDFPNLNTLWATILVETLFRLGLTEAIICPGSRSTPLTLALAKHPGLATLPILDERSAAFFALGRVKKLGLPVALVCTSGTAGANFYPAVIEAKESRLPMLILSADRPRELRDCHAGQTIDQTRLYGHYPNWYTELTHPELGLLPYLRQTLVQAWERCLFPTPGVVHVNIPWREPLTPNPAAEETLVSRWVEADFFGHLQPRVYPSPVGNLPNLTAQKGIIIAGVTSCLSPENYSLAIANLAQGLQFPVLAEALSPVRNYAHLNPYLVFTYDLILRQPQWQQALIPEVIIQIGELPTSKELRAWLTQLSCPRLIIDPSGENLDPLHGQTSHLRMNVEAWKYDENTPRPSPDHNYLQTWLDLNEKVAIKIKQTFSAMSDLQEMKIPWLLSQFLPKNTPIFLANSMTVRNAEFFWLPNSRQIMPYFNRGANGIDGTISTALGLAHENVPTVLLSGDLAFLHDTNGLLIREKFRGSLTIILVNNNGGGIFENLPIAHFDPPFEEFFATPQNINFAQLCRTYDLLYSCIENWSQLQEKIQALPARGIQVLEVVTDRKKDAQWLREQMGTFADFGGKT